MSSARSTFSNVTPASRCRICGKGDWCRKAEDGTADCYRVNNGHGRVKTDANGMEYYRYGGNIYSPPSSDHNPEPKAPCADVETCDRVYRGWVEVFHLAAKHKRGLQERGLSEEWITAGEYRTLVLEGRSKVARELVERFSPGVCAQIPGIYWHEEGYVQLAGSPGLLIPIRDAEKRIQAFLSRPDEPGEGGKYRFISSAKHQGASPGSPVHVPLFTGDTTRVRLTEGALKADVTTVLSGLLTLGLPGVSGWNKAVEQLRQLGATVVPLAFDADGVRNYHVARALEGALRGLREAGFIVELELWDEADGKGIDDLLRAGKQPSLFTGSQVDIAIAGIVTRARDYFRQQAEADGDPLAETREVLSGLMETIRTDPGAVFQPEALEALALVRACDRSEWARIKRAFQKAKVSLRDLEAALPQRDRQNGHGNPGEAEAEEAHRERLAGDMLQDAPAPGLIIPEPYFLNENATGYMEHDDDGRPRPRILAYAPILVTGRMRDVDEAVESFRVAWKRPHGWLDTTIDRGVAVNARKLIETATNGFPVADGNAKSLTDYLHKLEAANYGRLPAARVSSHLAWQGRNGELGFLWGRTLFSGDGQEVAPINLDELSPDDWREEWIAFRGLAGGDEQIADGFHAAGSAEEYFRALLAVSRYPRVLLGFYASFVPPLLQIIKAPNFILEWARRTSTGKTVTLRVAASVWGKPDEKAPDGCMWSWDSTRVGAERLCSILSGLPVILDDTKRVKNPAGIAEMIYLVVNGRGRARGTPKGLARTRAWRTVLLSSGEAPATSFTQDGGTRPRCLEVRGLPFDGDDGETRKVVDSLNLAILSHYGHAGPLFIRWLLQNRDRWDGFTEEYHRQVEHYAAHATSAVGGRMAQSAAAIDLAAALAHAALDLPWDYRDPLEHVWAGIIQDATQDVGEVRALRDVISWAWSNANSFIGRHDEDREGNVRTPVRGWAGKWDSSSSWEWIAFYPTRLSAVLKEHGFEPEGIYPEWKERGWLETSGDSYTRKVSVGRFDPDAERPRMIVVKRAAVTEVDA